MSLRSISLIRTQCLALKKMAEKANLPTLAFLLDMAALEAVNHEMRLQKGEPPTSPRATKRKIRVAA